MSESTTAFAGGWLDASRTSPTSPLVSFIAKAAEGQANGSAEGPRLRSLPRSRRASWSRDWLSSSETQSGGRGPLSHNHSLCLSPANLVWAASAGQRLLVSCIVFYYSYSYGQLSVTTPPSGSASLSANDSSHTRRLSARACSSDEEEREAVFRGPRLYSNYGGILIIIPNPRQRDVPSCSTDEVYQASGRERRAARPTTINVAMITRPPIDAILAWLQLA